MESKSFPPLPVDTFVGQSHPLWGAIKDNDLPRIASLAADGVDLNVRFLCDAGYTALERAVGASSTPDPSKLPLVEALLRAGARASGHLVASMLTWAPSGRQELRPDEVEAFEATLRLLLGAGFDVNATSPTGQTAIMSPGLLLPLANKRLIEHGLDVDRRDEYGFTALLYKLCGDLACARTILDASPYVHARPWSTVPFINGESRWLGRTALQVMASLASSRGSMEYGDLSERVGRLETLQAPNEPSTVPFDPGMLAALSPHCGKLFRLGRYLDTWWARGGMNRRELEAPVFLRATFFDAASLDAEVMAKLEPGLRTMEKMFVPCGLLFTPEASLKKGFSVECVSKRAILGLIGIDKTPKPDGRRPVYAGLWGRFHDSSVRIAQHPGQLELEPIDAA